MHFDSHSLSPVEKTQQASTEQQVQLEEGSGQNIVFCFEKINHQFMGKEQRVSGRVIQLKVK